LAGCSGSAAAGSRNTNFHQRLAYLSKVDLEAIVPRNADIAPRIEARIRLRRSQVGGSARRSALAVDEVRDRSVGHRHADRTIVSLGGWLATRFRKTAWVADIWDSPDLELVTYYRGAKGSLLESERLSNVLDDLGEQFELVLFDTPPLLVLGDAIRLTSRVDAVVLVLHAGIRRTILQELSRQLQNSHAPILGFVLTGVSEGDTYGS